jgi:hypothetical protein
MLKQIDSLPEQFLTTQPEQLLELLGTPSLVHLPGRREQPLFVSILLHGNETTGLLAIQHLLQKYKDKKLPRALSLFIGNVEAAQTGLRRLAGQPDYNRVWPGSEEEACPEQRMMAEIVDTMRARNVFASVDVHNNTGINPHYACINIVNNQFMYLASLFSRTLVYFTRPTGVQSRAFSEICPAVTVECGKVGQSAGVEHASEFIEACLHLSEIPDHPIAVCDVDLFHTVAIVKVPRAFSFGFENSQADISFVPDLDHLNFRELPAGFNLAKLNSTDATLEAWDEQGKDVANRFFDTGKGVLRTTRPVMPSMFSLDERVIRQDCLGYLMERYPLPTQSQ